MASKVLAVLVIFENGLLCVAAGGDVVHCAGIFDAKGAGHAWNIAEKWLNGKKVDLTPALPQQRLKIQ